MKILFFIRSDTVDLSKFNIKDIPGTSGRLDVIARCVIAALFKGDFLDKNVQIWIYLDKYGTLIFDSNEINAEEFPKNELLLSDFIVKIINNRKSISPISILKEAFTEVIHKIENLGYKIYILSEKGKDFFRNLKSLKKQEKLAFIIGNQTGEFIDSEELGRFNFPNLSLGNQSYLASSIIRLIKINIKT
ncbi:MAG: hypothetical protein ACTSVV_05985 [Promethearchaeota archaeon]